MHSKIYSIHRFPCPLLAMMFAMLCLVTSCSKSEESPFEEQNTLLTIYLEAPKSATRADEGTVTGTADENGLYQTYIWVFDSSHEDDATAAPVGSITQNLNGATSATLQVSIDRDVISRAPNLDVFVVANVESVPSAYYSMGPDNPPITRKRLKEMIFGKISINTRDFDDFGTSQPTHAPESGKGVPMSQYALNQKVINSGVLDKPVNLALQRAVSKIRFAFARRTGVENVTVTGITLNDELIPTTTCLFPSQPTNASDPESVALAKRTPNLPDGVTYEDGFAYGTSLPDDQILPHDDPASLAMGSTEDAQAYLDRLKTAFGTYTSSLNYGLTYLRETGKKLTGTIRYKLGEDEYSAPFEMAEAGDFTRNHEYLVYAYFEKSGLNVTVSVMDWEKYEIVHQFANTVATAEGGQIKWTDGTYREKTSNLEIIMHSDTDIHPHFTFNLGSPKGATWHATFRTQEGDNTAFSLHDAQGNECSQGIIDGKPVDLYVHAREEHPGQTNKAELIFVVRCNGETLPVDVLTPEGQGNYIIVQEHI